MSLLARLDARTTDYRFALDEVPWERLNEPGQLVGPTLRRLLDCPDLDGAAIAVAFASLERDLIRYLHAEQPGGRSIELLLEEEVRHAEMFDRLAAHFSSAIQPPPDTFRRLAEVENPEHRQYLFWLHCLFFEELTVWIYDALQRDGDIQSTWLAAHRLHAREETQHVLTDAAFLELSALDAQTRDQLSRAFVLYVDQHIDAFFGIAGRESKLRNLPLFSEVLNHRAFARTRKYAPYLLTLAARRDAVLVGPPLIRSDETLPAALERSANSNHGISFAGRSETTLSYRELHTRALIRLGGLQSKGLQPGNPVVVVCAMPSTTTEALWACLLGGLVPALVPYPTGGKDSESHRRLFRVASQLDAPLLTDQDGFTSRSNEVGRKVILLSQLPANNAGSRHPAHPDDLALLQYSSGSMGQPRGVRLTHRQILANIQGMSALRGRDDDRFASWLPLSHDMGLIGFHLAPLVLGCDQLLAPPRVWLRSPAGWLRTMAEFGATVTGLPASALPALLAEPFDVDLSHLHTILVGAEPIDARFLHAAAERLAPLGLAPDALCPAYGLAEAVLAVTMHKGPPSSLKVERESLQPGTRVVRAADDDDEFIEVVRVGTPLPGLTVRAGAQAGEVGEIVVRGTSVGDGYQGNPERWAEFATGDLGFVWDGALYVCGRQKETFEVHGQTFHAHDIERVAQEVPGVRAAALGLGEQRVLFVVPAAEAKGSNSLLTLVRRHLRLRLDFEPDHVVPTTPSALLRTTSGKLRRNAILAEWEGTVGAEETDMIRKIWSDVLGLPLAEIGPDDHFRELGGSSIRALEVHARLEDALNRELGHEILEAPTPRAIARRLSGQFRPGPTAAASLATAERTSTPAAARLTPAAPSADPLAIVALAVRFPGADSPDTLWEMLRDGKTSIERVSRWDTTGLSSASGALFPLTQIYAFDAPAFSLSEAEAREMDPQHRLAMELAAEACQQAPPDTQRVGLYLACGDLEVGDRSAIGPHSLLGSLKNMVAGRIAATLGFTGPAMAVDTACSSSLVAVHLAARAVRGGECDFALAGGVQLLLTPQGFRSFDAAGLLSSTGRSQPFDREAAGLVPGEGGGLVGITTLERARRLGHTVLALLHGSAVTNDGGGLSSTAPSPDGQESAMRAAWADAKLPPSHAEYVEAHAAGTAIGDAVEATATARMFGDVAIASVKGNLGHTLAAAGIAGLARTVLSIQHRWLPPSAGLSQPTGRIAWENNHLKPLLCGQPWAGEGFAGVSSFGLGGTNAHVVLSAPDAVYGASATQMHLPPPSPTFAIAPSAFHPRLQSVLTRLQGGAPSIALLFAGPGGQHVGMARALRDAVPAFATLLAECGALSDGDLLASFDDERCLDIEHAQRTNFALTWALGRWLLDLGLQPTVIFGHSGGELSAAVLAGVLTLQEGWALATERGRLMARVPGGLLAVLGPLSNVPDGTWISARNAPDQTVLAGTEAALEAAIASLGAERTRRLAVTCPAHSPLLTPEIAAYTKLVAAIPTREATLPLLSTRTGRPLHGNPEHWRDQLLGAVEFEATVRSAHAMGATMFVDLGPSSALAAAVRSTLKDVDVVSLLSRSDGSIEPSRIGLQRIVVSGGLPRLVGVSPVPLRFNRQVLQPALPARLPAQYERVQHQQQATTAGEDHVVGGVSTLPAAALYDFALHATGASVLQRAIMLRPCPASAQLTLAGGQILADGVAVLRFEVGALVAHPPPVDLAELRNRCPTVGSARHVHQTLATSGMVLSPRFWALRSLVLGTDELLAELTLAPKGESGNVIDPALLDSASQSAAALGNRETTWVGFAVESFCVYGPVHGGCLAWLSVRQRSPELVVCDLSLLDFAGNVLVAVQGMSARPAVPVGRAAIGIRTTTLLPDVSGPPKHSQSVAIRGLIARRVNRTPDAIGLHTPFSQLGIDSLAAVEIAAQLESLFGRRLPVTLLFECPDLSALQARLGDMPA